MSLFRFPILDQFDGSTESDNVFFKLAGLAVDGGGTQTWSTPSNAANTVSTTQHNSSPNVASNQLIVTDFNFDIPAAATIVGIECQISYGGGNSGTFRENNVQLVYNGGMLSNDSVASASTITANTDQVRGDPTNLWGTDSSGANANIPLTPALLNDTDFGVTFSIITTLSGFKFLRVNNIRLAVYFELAIGDATGRVSQDYVEVFAQETGLLRTSQVYLEVLTHTVVISDLRLSQVYAELFNKSNLPMRLSQVYAEVIIPHRSPEGPVSTTMIGT